MGRDLGHHYEEHTVWWKSIEFFVVVRTPIKSITPDSWYEPGEMELHEHSSHMLSVECPGYDSVVLEALMGYGELPEFLEHITASTYEDGWTKLK